MSRRTARTVRGGLAPGGSVPPGRLVLLTVALVLLGLVPLVPSASAGFRATTAAEGSTFYAAESFGIGQNATASLACANQTGADSCATVQPLDGAWSLAMTDQHLYVVASLNSATGNAVVGFTRDAASGALTRVAGTAGCVSYTGAYSCATGGLRNPSDLALSPDGQHVYVAAHASWAVTVLQRNTTTGAISPVAGTAGCVSETGKDGGSGATVICADGRGLYNPSGIAVSPDGQNVYVASSGTDGGSGSITAFQRNATTGVLTQLAGVTGCVSDVAATSCADGRALVGAFKVEVSPDGKFVYATARDASAVSTFSRSQVDGGLTQLTGTSGCVRALAGDGCAVGVALDRAARMALSDDGLTAYVVATNADAVAVFDRSTVTGVLTQKTGTAGCWSDTTAGCTVGKLLDGATSLAFSPDQENLYVGAATSKAVHALTRDSQGRLSQSSATRACTTATVVAGCLDARGLTDPMDVIVSPDGKHVYVSNYVGDGITVLIR